jgi:uncharacterized membrane protein HdeD (DUF308 family)
MKNSDDFFSEAMMSSVVRTKWGWFVALGLISLFFGVLALGNLTLATGVSVFYVGIFMTFSGLFQILHAFQFRTWSGFFYFIFSGILYGVAGIIAFQNPILAAATLTLFLSMALIASGAIRIWSSVRLKGQYGWAWILSSGFMTAVAGIIFLMDWPVNSLWLLGMVLAMDLTFQGVATIMLGLNLKSSKLNTKIYDQGPASVY